MQNQVNSTSTKYMQQKKYYALSSNFRPKQEKILECNIRQTLFPTGFHHMNES